MCISVTNPPNTKQKQPSSSKPATNKQQEYDSSKHGLAQGDEWLKDFDLEGFRSDVKALGKELEAQQGPADVAHLNKIVMWSNLFAFAGLFTMGFEGWGIGLFSAVCLSTWTFSRWTMIAHHTCHGGYDKCHPNKGRWNRFKFAVGGLWNRICDWFDWMMPEAWNVEHNNRHHYCLSELDDPDLVENNLKDVREANIPLVLKYVIVLINMTNWKWQYYAPNTYKELKLARMRRHGQPIPEGVNPTDAVTVKTLLTSTNPFYSISEFILVVIGPYLLLHFFVMPLPWMFAASKDAYWIAVRNLFVAEIFTNVHAFVAIVTNHAGDDMYRFRDGCKPFSGSFFLRQVLASVDFDMGTDTIDFMHGWLNYQIEHHLWPNLSMLSYQKSAPLVRALCKKHNVPYVQENVLWRTKKTVDIMVGISSMKWFPADFEARFLEIDRMADARDGKK